MKHLFVFLSLLLTWGSAQAQTEKKTPVTNLPGEENLSVRERAERDFLMPVRRKKVVIEAPKSLIENNTASPESDASAHYAETADEAAALPAHTTRSYEARHSEALAARRAAYRREEARAEARAEARRAAHRHSSKSKSKSHASKSKAKTSKSKTKSTAHSSKSKAKSKASSARKTTAKSKASSAKKRTPAKKVVKKTTPSKTKTKTKSRR